jgi:hypothetical protein
MTADSLGQMRASDRDRDNTADWLRTAFAEGRLTKDEYDERIGQALSSKTYAELEGSPRTCRESSRASSRQHLPLVLSRGRTHWPSRPWRAA